MLELIYTSAKAGLKTGSSGFVSVAWTRGIPPHYIDPLEVLCSYKHVYLPGDPLSAKNPVSFCYLKVKYGNMAFPCIGRISDAGLDYTSRSNKIAHLIVPENRAELNSFSEGWGPAGLFLPDTNFTKSWQKEPELLPPRKPKLPAPPATLRAETWEKWTGDAGWAGVIAGRAREILENQDADFSDSLYLVYDLELPPEELIRMIAEVTALLPAPLQTECTFNTYFVQQQLGVSVLLRAVLEGGDLHQTMQRMKPKNVYFLCKKSPVPHELENDPFVSAARSGIISREKTLEIALPEYISRVPEKESFIQPPPPEPKPLQKPRKLKTLSEEKERFFRIAARKAAETAQDEDERIQKRTKIIFLSLVFAVLLIFAGILAFFLLHKSAPEPKPETPVETVQEEPPPPEEKKIPPAQPTVKTTEPAVKPAPQKKQETPEPAPEQVLLSDEKQTEIFYFVLKMLYSNESADFPLQGNIVKFAVQTKDQPQMEPVEKYAANSFTILAENGTLKLQCHEAPEEKYIPEIRKIKTFHFYTKDNKVLQCPFGINDAFLKELQPTLTLERGYHFKIQKADKIKECPLLEQYFLEIPPNPQSLSDLQAAINTWNAHLKSISKDENELLKKEERLKKYDLSGNVSVNKKLQEIEAALNKEKKNVTNPAEQKKNREAAFQELYDLTKNDLPIYMTKEGPEAARPIVEKAEKLWNDCKPFIKKSDKLKGKLEEKEALFKKIKECETRYYEFVSLQKLKKNYNEKLEKTDELRNELKDEADKYDVWKEFQDYCEKDQSIPEDMPEVCRIILEKTAPKYQYKLKGVE